MYKGDYQRLLQSMGEARMKSEKNSHRALIAHVADYGC
jgi:hypothetical protein